jgi:ribosome-associated protein
MNSSVLMYNEKQLLLDKAASKINSEGILKLTSQTERTQLGNKEVVTDKFYKLLQKAFTKKKKRILTKVSKATKEKRLEEKHINSLKKAARNFKTKI